MQARVDPSRSPAAFDVQLDQTQRRITACGELDFANGDVLAGVMTTLIGLNRGDSTVDISGLTFIDAGGLGCLESFGNQLTAFGAELSVTGATPRLRRIFDIVGLGGLLDAA